MALVHLEYYTYKDYRHWKGNWELIEGCPYAMNSFALPRHQIICSNILFELKKELQSCKKCVALMDSEIIISEDTILRPDVIVYCDEIEDMLIKTPPIIFEVALPSTLKRDELIKKEIYEREGVKYYIIIYLEEDRAKVYENVNGRFLKIADESKKIKFKFDCEIEFDFSKIWSR